MKTEELVEFLEELDCSDVVYTSSMVEFKLHGESYYCPNWKSKTRGSLCEGMVSKAYLYGFSAGGEEVRSDFRSLLRVEEGPQEYT